MAVYAGVISISASSRERNVSETGLDIVLKRRRPPNILTTPRAGCNNMPAFNVVFPGPFGTDITADQGPGVADLQEASYA